MSQYLNVPAQNCFEIMNSQSSRSELRVVKSDETHVKTPKRPSPSHDSNIMQRHLIRALTYKTRLIKALLVIVLISMLGIGWLLYRNLQAAAQSSTLETHSRVVIQEFGELLSSIKDAETGQRGFIITGSKNYLAPYVISIDATWTHLAELRRLAADNPSQLQRLGVIKLLVTNKLAELKETILLRQTKGFDAASELVLSDTGRQLMDQIRVQVAMAEIEQQKLLNEGMIQKNSDTHRVNHSFLISAILATLSWLLLFFYVRWKLACMQILDSAWQLSETRHAQLFNSITQGFCIIEKRDGQPGQPPDFHYIEANPAFAVQTGINNVVGKTLRQVLPEEFEEWLLTYDAVLKIGKPIRFERALIAQGRVLELHAFRVEDQVYKRVGVSFTDITQRHQSQAALRAADERYLNLFNSIDEGFATFEVMFDADEVAIDCRFLKINMAFKKQTGLDVVPNNLMREVAPDFEAHWYEAFGQVVLTGNPVRFISASKGLNGRWFDIYVMPVDEPINKNAAVLIKDITQRIQSEKALRENAARFQAMFEHGPIAMYSVDAVGVIQEFNQNAVILWGREPVRGDMAERFCGSFKLHSPDGSALPHAQTPMAAVLNGDILESHDVEVIIERPDGSRITVNASVVPLKNCKQEITGAIASLYDITERSRLERKSLNQVKSLTEQD